MNAATRFATRLDACLFHSFIATIIMQVTKGGAAPVDWK